MSTRALGVALVAAAIAFPSTAGAVQLDTPGASSAPERLPTKLSTLEVADVAVKLVSSVSKDSKEPAMTGDDLIWPVRNTINTPFGGGHDGIDIEGLTGDPIVAAGSGRITFAGDDGDGYGTKIVINHGSGVSTLYSHLNSMKVTEGFVKQGDVIGTIGCTGSCSGDHLHFEIHRGGTAVEPTALLPH